MDTKEIILKVPEPGQEIIYFYAEVDESNAQTFIKDIKEIHYKMSNLEKENSDILEKYFNIPAATVPKNVIKINLCSPGGYCYHGFSICNTISELSKYRDVEIHASGYVASMAIPILLSVPLEKRSAHKDTTFMIHSVASITLGKLAQLEEDVEEVKRINKRLFEYIAANSKVPKDKLVECHEKKRDWWITAEEALELGLISKII